MTTPIDTDGEALRSALRAARENAERWMEMYPQSPADSEEMEQWRSTARLRRSEVERLEILLARLSERRHSTRHSARKNAGAGNEQDDDR